MGHVDAGHAATVVPDPKCINTKDTEIVNRIVASVANKAYALSSNEGSAPEAMHVDLFTRWLPVLPLVRLATVSIAKDETLIIIVSAKVKPKLQSIHIY